MGAAHPGCTHLLHNAQPIRGDVTVAWEALCPMRHPLVIVRLYKPNNEALSCQVVVTKLVKVPFLAWALL